MAFVDYNKAFDSLSHSYIWKTLEKQGVERKYIRIIKEIYRRTTATIQLEQQGEEFGIEKGVRQGDPLSPKLSIAVLEDIFRNLDWEHFGININGSNLNHLRFADDIVLFVEKPGTLQTILQQLDGESRKAGLCMNLTQTKLITNAVKENIVIGEESIEYVDEYIYLRQTISINDQYSKEIDRRISNTWKRYWSLKEITKNEAIPMAIKNKLYNTCILSCLTYGCQTWPTTSKNNQKLIVCQRNMERRMLNIRLQDRWTTLKIRKRTKVRDVLKNIRKLKWNWTGHTMRTNKEKWTKDVLEWYPRNGKRKRGGQIKRWEDDLPKGWRRSTGDREEWQKLGVAYVDRQPKWFGKSSGFSWKVVATAALCTTEINVKTLPTQPKRMSNATLVKPGRKHESTQPVADIRIPDRLGTPLAASAAVLMKKPSNFTMKRPCRISERQASPRSPLGRPIY
ncbi:Putative uncharacterized transposon-derived protein F52C9.6 [Eumeta japonica]|uniref:Uncharacterized transposon-derived protein F52C9.6 n=1 Tax=Eumeta variegata TaxID=151549 RepID=A0A4C1YKF7_EUMVA|nr:Putative uncharacterized transposon-derived protein F52C9.6 [Eumeta japonica]